MFKTITVTESASSPYDAGLSCIRHAMIRGIDWLLL